MTVLVTGATGLLGSHLTELLVERGERPRVLLRPGDSVAGVPVGAVEVHWGDIANRAALEAATDGVDRVLHCAARTGPWGPQAEYESTNVRGLETLVHVALAAGVRRLVHVSSVTVHGNDVGVPVDETAPFRLEPNPYGRSKIAGERLLERMIRERGAPVSIVRPGLIYGPRDAASFGRFARLILQRRMIVVGSGANHIPLIFVRDAAMGILLASEAEQAIGKAYLLVNDEPVTQSGYLAAIASELGVSPPTTHIPYRLALAVGAAAEMAGRMARLKHAPPLTRFGLQVVGGENQFMIDRARRDLGFVPRVMLDEGVRRSVDWYRNRFAATSKLKEAV
jgi:nucleoside-diphosphate-sugar epimerase